MRLLSSCIDILEDSETYLLYSGVCFIPSRFDDANTVVGETTRSICRKLCSGHYSLKCSAFLYDRRSNNCTLTPFTGELLRGSKEISALRRGCNGTTLEFFRRIRHLGKLKFGVYRPNNFTQLIRAYFVRSHCIHALKLV